MECRNMVKRKRYIFVTIISILILLLCSNKVFSAEDWDTFWRRFMEQTTSSGSTDNLSDADLERMINGPTKDERYGGAIYIDAASLESFQEMARQLKEARIQSGTWRKK